MKSSLRLNRQSKHTLAKLGLRRVKPANLPEYTRAKYHQKELGGK